MSGPDRNRNLTPSLPGLIFSALSYSACLAFGDPAKDEGAGRAPIISLFTPHFAQVERKR